MAFVGEYFTDIALYEVSKGMFLGFDSLKVASLIDGCLCNLYPFLRFRELREGSRLCGIAFASDSDTIDNMSIWPSTLVNRCHGDASPVWRRDTVYGPSVDHTQECIALIL